MPNFDLEKSATLRQNGGKMSRANDRAGERRVEASLEKFFLFASASVRMGLEQVFKRKAESHSA